MIDKTFATLADAVAGIHDGATVMIGGFGNAGMPSALIAALIEQGARDLTIVNNNAGNGETGLAALLKAKRVRKIICSFPRQADSQVFDALYRAGEIELELTPQGNLAERIRAAGAGIGGFFTPTGYGTLLAEGKETRLINGRHYVFEEPIHADFALIKALRGDRWAIWSTARRRATSDRSWPWPPGPPSRRCAKWWRWASSIPRSSSRPASLCNAWSRREYDEPLQPRPDRRPRRAGHPRRRLRQPRHRPADAGRQLSAGRPRDFPAQRKRPARHGPGARARRRGRRPDQRRQAAGDAADRRRLFPPRRLVRDDARRPPRHLRARRLPGVRRRRPGQLAHRRAGRDSGRRRCDGPGAGRQVGVRDDGPPDQDRREQDRPAVRLPADRGRLRAPHLHRPGRARRHAGRSEDSANG